MHTFFWDSETGAPFTAIIQIGADRTMWNITPNVFVWKRNVRHAKDALRVSKSLANFHFWVKYPFKLVVVPVCLFFSVLFFPSVILLVNKTSWEDSINKILWLRKGPVWFISLLLADRWHCYGLLLAQIWQTGADHIICARCGLDLTLLLSV